MESPARLEKITDYIIANHAVKTRNKEFTAMMCVSSVDVLIKYYELFAKRKAEGKHKLKIATIFSYTSNEEDKDADGILDEGGEIIGGEGGNPHTREKLDGFISDYNGMFGTNFSTKEKASILADVDFELELIHRDVINVQYILTLLASLYDADEADQADIRKLILDSVAGDIELRSKRELIQKFIDSNLPKLDSSAEIPDSFEDFWKKERVAAFDKLVKEEQLDADKLKQVIDRYVYTGQEPLPDPDIVELIQKPLGILERDPTRKRVLDKVVDYVATFIRGVAA
jgi:type I site-specific restriction-modification system R (restriction) subunit